MERPVKQSTQSTSGSRIEIQVWWAKIRGKRPKYVLLKCRNKFLVKDYHDRCLLKEVIAQDRTLGKSYVELAFKWFTRFVSNFRRRRSRMVTGLKITTTRFSIVAFIIRRNVIIVSFHITAFRCMTFTELHRIFFIDWTVYWRLPLLSVKFVMVRITLIAAIAVISDSVNQVALLTLDKNLRNKAMILGVNAFTREVCTYKKSIRESFVLIFLDLCLWLFPVWFKYQWL